MVILAPESATLHRADAPTINPDTGATEPPTRTSTPISGSFQPLGGREREALPEGVRAKVTLKLYTHDEVRTVDQMTPEFADVIEYRGDRYVAFTVMQYPTLLAHYKVLLMREGS